MERENLKKLVFVVFSLILVLSFISYFVVAVINKETVDSTNDVGWFSSIALDSNEKVHISHHDNTNNATRYCNNTAGSWSCLTVESINDNAFDHGQTSLAIDSNNKEHISWSDTLSDDTRYCNNTAGTWSCAIADTTSGTRPSIVIDSNNKIHISHAGSGISPAYGPRYCNNTAGSWSCLTVESANSFSTSMAIDSNNKIHIVYTNVTSGVDNLLRYCNNTAGSWSCTTITKGTDWAGSYFQFGIYGTSIAIDSNNKVHITTSESGYRSLYCNNTAGSWSCINNIESSYDGLEPSIAIDSNNKIHIIKFESATIDQLRYCNNILGSWKCIKIDDGEGYSQQKGRSIAIKKGRIVDSTSFSNYVHISYYNNTDLRYANIIIDSSPPNVTKNTPLNQTYTTNTITFNVTAVDNGGNSISSCWYTINNGTTNYTLYPSGTNNYNSTNSSMAQGSHTAKFYCKDTYELGGGNINDSEKVTFFIDSLEPSIIIDHPKAQNYNYNESLSLNYTVADSGIGVESCWYKVVNATNGGIVISNTTIPSCSNTTFNLSEIDNNYNLTLYSNDSLGNLNYSVITFGIRMNAPSVMLDYPKDNSYLNSGTNVYFNWTAVDSDGLDTFNLYINNVKNYTWISPTNNTMNHTVLNMSEGRYNWTVGGNDTFDNIGWVLNNFTLTVDLTFPNVTINSITPTTGSLIVSFNSTETDNFEMSKCWYTVFNAVGLIDGSLSNISYSCSNGLLAHAFIVSNYGTYNLTIYANDSANNFNSSTSSFTTISSSPASPGTSGPAPVQNITVGSFCGDNICQKPNDYGIYEDFYNCPQDCKGFNFDDFFYSITTWCFDKNESTPCLWTSIFMGFSTQQPENLTKAMSIVPFNADTAIFNCFEGKECFWETSIGAISLFGIVIFIAALFIIKIPYERGGSKKGRINQYILYKVKKKRKRR